MKYSKARTYRDYLEIELDNKIIENENKFLNLLKTIKFKVLGFFKKKD